MAPNKKRAISGVQFPLPPQGATQEELSFYKRLREYVDAGLSSLQLPDYNKNVKQILVSDDTGLSWLPLANAVSNVVFYPIIVWWQRNAEIEHWVKDLGVNIFMWEDATTFTTGDFEDAHERIEALRQEGYDVRVIRRPAKYLKPEYPSTPLTVDFDIKWYKKGHIHAFEYPDEYEDKVPGGGGGDVNHAPSVLYAAYAALMADYDAWVISMGLTPGKIPYFETFNGTHVGPTTQTVYMGMVNSGPRPIDIICSDSYPCDNQQYYVGATHPPATNALLYPDVVAEMINALGYFKTWFAGTNIKVMYFLECCNQAQHVVNTTGFTSDWKFVGSRAPTSAELYNAVAGADSLGADGLAWFPQANGGATTDATDPNLMPVMLDIANKHNGGKTQGTVNNQIIIEEGGGITDAPSDGSIYGRKNGAWTVDAGGASFPGGSITAFGLGTISSVTGTASVSCSAITGSSIVFFTAAWVGSGSVIAGFLWKDSYSGGVGFGVRYTDASGTNITGHAVDFAWLVVEP